MKTLHTFVARKEQTEQVSKMLSEMVRRTLVDVELVNLSQKSIDILAPYDQVILGGEVWFGSLSPKLTDYIKRNKQELLIKPLFIYLLSYTAEENFQDQVSGILDHEVLEHARTYHIGMNVDTTELSPWEKLKWMVMREKVITPLTQQQIMETVSDITRSLD